MSQEVATCTKGKISLKQFKVKGEQKNESQDTMTKFVVKHIMPIFARIKDSSEIPSTVPYLTIV